MTVTLRYPESIPLGWQHRAACRSMDKALFYGKSDGGTSASAAREKDRPGRTAASVADAARIREAQAVCGACPVRLECLRHAMKYPEPWGIWGGLTPPQRAHLRTKVRKRQEARRAERREAEGGGHGDNARSA